LGHGCSRSTYAGLADRHLITEYLCDIDPEKPRRFTPEPRRFIVKDKTWGEGRPFILCTKRLTRTIADACVVSQEASDSICLGNIVIPIPPPYSELVWVGK
jgi:hypothetical protein